MHIDKESRLLLRALNQEGVRYLLVGEHAAVYHGTVDEAEGNVMLFIDNTPQNVQHLATVLCDLDPVDVIGADPDRGPFDPLRRPIFVDLPKGCVLFVPELSGVEFDDCYRKRVLTTREILGNEIHIPVISIDDWLCHREVFLRERMERELGKLRERRASRDQGYEF